MWKKPKLWQNFKIKMWWNSKTHGELPSPTWSWHTFPIVGNGQKKADMVVLATVVCVVVCNRPGVTWAVRWRVCYQPRHFFLVFCYVWLGWWCWWWSGWGHFKQEVFMEWVLKWPPPPPKKMSKLKQENF